MLARYEDLIPGSAERIIGMAERQSAHRQELEKQVVGGGVSAEQRGQWMGFVVAMSALGGGFWLISQGQPAWGIALVVADLAAFAGVFVYGRRSQTQERERKFHRFVERSS